MEELKQRRMSNSIQLRGYAETEARFREHFEGNIPDEFKILADP